MKTVLDIVLLVMGSAGFVAAGVTVAVARNRECSENESDPGLYGLAALVFIIAAFCTTVSAGLLGVAAIGGVFCWVSYIASAQRLGLFEIETGQLETRLSGTSRART